jgi:hypothetical protein
MTQPSSEGTQDQGNPEVPEERRAQGHDAKRDPAVETSGFDTPLPNAAPAGKSDVPRDDTSKADDARFLVEQFDVPERRAARAVLGETAPDSKVAELGAEVHRHVSGDDPLAGVPTPEEPATDLAGDTDEVRLKPVLHTRNQRTGAG